MINWKWVWMLGLIAAAIATYGVLVGNPDEGTATGERPVQPGYYLKDAILTITQPDGSPRIKIVARRIDEHVADKSYGAEGVHVDYLAVPGKPWTLKSDQAAVPADLQSVVFNGNVEVRSLQTEQGGVIRTQSLALDMQSNVATTDEPVEIEFAGQQLHATGLKADMKNERLQLESAVNGNFR
jgi:lipopolysaccharide export system protein LptC